MPNYLEKFKLVILNSMRALGQISLIRLSHLLWH
jgi:hypothetical protein